MYAFLSKFADMDYSKIKAITFDVDGVMTDGSLTQLDNGDLLRTFNAKDTFAVRYAVTNGIKVGVFTGGSTPGILKRFLTCLVPEDDIHMGCRGKITEFRSFCEKYGLEPEEVLYFGDDIPDIPVIKAAGIGIAPADAADDVKAVADYVSPFPGGRGCVREGVEKVMKAAGKWGFDDGYGYEKVY